MQMTAHTSTTVSEPPLVDEQRRVAECLERLGRVMVEAPPGTGKTFTGVYLALLAYRLGWTSHVRPALLVTFSRNARAQVEHEVRRFRTRGWMTSGEAAAIKVTNYHSLFFEVITKRAGLWGCRRKMRPAPVQDREHRIDRVLRDAGVRGKARLEARRALQALPSLLVLADTASLPGDLAAVIAQEARNAVATGRPHYDDFAPLMLQLIRTSPSLVEWLQCTFPLLVLDEYQDTDGLQWDILRLWRPERLAVFYDRFQMIYQWRGSSPERPGQFAREFSVPPQAQLRLRTLHRCGSERQLARYILQLRADRLQGGRVVREPRSWLTLHASPERDGRWVPAEQRCLTAIRFHGGICPGETTAIITRTNALAKYVQAYITHMPSTIAGPYYRCARIGGYDSADELLREYLMQLRLATSDRELGGWLGRLVDKLLISPCRIGATEIRFHEEWARPAAKILARHTSPKLRAVREATMVWRDKLGIGQYSALHLALQSILNLGDLLTDGRACTDPDWHFYIGQLATAVAATPNDEAWDDFCDRLEDAVLAAAHIVRRGPRLCVLTVHQSKGREFDHVILPWMCEDGESLRGGDRGRYDFDDDEHRRLLYVALTRARKRVTVIYPAERPARILREWKLI